MSSELTHAFHTESLTGLADSMPIIMAQRGRRFHAKVAPELATKNVFVRQKNCITIV